MDGARQDCRQQTAGSIGLTVAVGHHRPPVVERGQACVQGARRGVEKPVVPSVARGLRRAASALAGMTLTRMHPGRVTS